MSFQKQVGMELSYISWGALSSQWGQRFGYLSEINDIGNFNKEKDRKSRTL